MCICLEWPWPSESSQRNCSISFFDYKVESLKHCKKVKDEEQLMLSWQLINQPSKQGKPLNTKGTVTEISRHCYISTLEKRGCASKGKIVQ